MLRQPRLVIWSAVTALASVRCASSGPHRCSQSPSGSAAEPSDVTAAQCSLFVQHFGPIFEQAQNTNGFSPDGTIKLPLVVPSVDAPRLERLDHAFNEKAPPAPRCLEIDRRSRAIGQAYLENMRGLLRAVAAQDTTSYRELSAQHMSIQGDITALDRDVSATCSSPLIKKSGRLPAEVIQAIIRKNYDTFQRCYAGGLARKPELGGRITVRFVIAMDGSVNNVQRVETTSLGPEGLRSDPRTEAFFVKLGLPTPVRNMDAAPMQDAAVVGCVVDHYRTLRFPPPEGGEVTVVYPIMFSPQ
jgi:hypothetical protein